MTQIKLHINTDILELRKSEIEKQILKLQEELIFLNDLITVDNENKK